MASRAFYWGLNFIIVPKFREIITEREQKQNPLILCLCSLFEKQFFSLAEIIYVAINSFIFWIKKRKKTELKLKRRWKRRREFVLFEFLRSEEKTPKPHVKLQWLWWPKFSPADVSHWYIIHLNLFTIFMGNLKYFFLLNSYRKKTDSQ